MLFLFCQRIWLASCKFSKDFSLCELSMGEKHIYIWKFEINES